MKKYKKSKEWTRLKKTIRMKIISMMRIRNNANELQKITDNYIKLIEEKLNKKKKTFSRMNKIDIWPCHYGRKWYFGRKQRIKSASYGHSKRLSI